MTHDLSGTLSLWDIAHAEEQVVRVEAVVKSVFCWDELKYLHSLIECRILDEITVFTDDDYIKEDVANQILPGKILHVECDIDYKFNQSVL